MFSLPAEVRQVLYLMPKIQPSNQNIVLHLSPFPNPEGMDEGYAHQTFGPLHCCRTTWVEHQLVIIIHAAADLEACSAAALIDV